MHVGLLACDEVASRFQHIAGTYQQMFERLLSPHIAGLRITRFDVQAGETPADARACDAWITTGSRASVYDDAAWIRSLETFIRTAAAAEQPFVGICFGHQALARTFGAEVKRDPSGWGVGVLPMQVVQQEAWMTPPLASVRLQYMHADQVTQPPRGATLLAEAPHCPVAMFRVGARMVGIEGHPEFPPAYARALIEDRRERIGNDVAEAALARVDDEADSHVVGRWIARFFGARG